MVLPAGESAAFGALDETWFFAALIPFSVFVFTRQGLIPVRRI